MRTPTDAGSGNPLLRDFRAAGGIAEGRVEGVAGGAWRADEGVDWSVRSPAGGAAVDLWRALQFHSFVHSQNGLIHSAFPESTLCQSWCWALGIQTQVQDLAGTPRCFPPSCATSPHPFCTRAKAGDSHPILLQGPYLRAPSPESSSCPRKGLSWDPGQVRND